MAKIQDKLYNRVIEGELLEITEEEKAKLGLVSNKLYKHTIKFIKGDSSSLTIAIKSFSSEPLTKGTLEDFIRNKAWFPYNDGSYPYAIIISVELPDIIYMAQNNDDLMAYMDFDVSDEGENWDIEDTVTPLE